MTRKGFKEGIDPLTGNCIIHKINSDKSQTQESKVNVEPFINLSDQKKVDVINGYAHYNISVDLSNENETNNYFEDKMSETLGISIKEVQNKMDSLSDDFTLLVLQGKVKSTKFDKVLIEILSDFEAEV